MKSLLLTLGHNSSAIFVEDGKLPIGYEEERLTGIKSDSQFPTDAIHEIARNVGIKNMKGCKVFISHWFDFIPDVMPNKYITQTDIDNLKEISDDITFVSPGFTHHDAHAYAGKAFFDYHFNKLNTEPNCFVSTKMQQNKDINIIVADGFGNNGEVISIYKINDYLNDRLNNINLEHRVYGYKNSIGLMYQYATSYVGMKENQDEYKFLGYEAHIDEYLNKYKIEILDTYIKELVHTLWEGFERDTNPNVYKKCEYLINFDSLKETKEYFHNIFREAYETVWKADDKAKYSKEDNEFIQRSIVAYYLQQTVEQFFGKVVEKFNMHNVIVVGGSFYNVKLNNYIFEHTDGLYCAMPLAGDQGAAIGLYYFYTGEQFNFETLCIGKRNFYGAEKVFKKNFYHEATDELAKEIARKIADGYIVDLVHGSMEFGPRALMHTSTLMIPTIENVDQTNASNLRNTVMPCAPVVTRKNAEFLFGKENLDRVIGSDEFMILTHTYKRESCGLYSGVMHKITLQNGYSGRPQIVKENTFEYKILQYVEKLCDIKCLVNTSFNAHGSPIIFTSRQIKNDFEFECNHTPEGKKMPLLYVVED